jgi:hypothetical protein
VTTFPEPGSRASRVGGNDATVKSVEKLEVGPWGGIVGIDEPDVDIELPTCLRTGAGAYEGAYDYDEGIALLDEPRKIRHHANAKSDKPERRFDTTALHFDQHGRLFSHADYIAHCEKYDYVWRHIQMGERILDVGCGTDTPLMRAINFVQSQAAKVLYREGGCYVGVDLNVLKPTNINWAQLIGELDITSDEGFNRCLDAVPQNAEIEAASAVADTSGAELLGYSLIVALEVIEHMDVDDGRNMLINLRDLLSGDGRIILSTPVYDGKGMARNHIHEYYISELRALIESVGLRVVRRMGTFTAEPQIKRWMKENRPDWLALYLEAREFHSAGYMSGIIAPMVPDMARNNVWVIQRTDTLES